MKAIIRLVGLLVLGAVISGCGVIYYPHDRGYHRGSYERERGRVMQKGSGRGDHDRGRKRARQSDHKGDHRGDRDQHP